MQLKLAWLTESVLLGSMQPYGPSFRRRFERSPPKFVPVMVKVVVGEFVLASIKEGSMLVMAGGE